MSALNTIVLNRAMELIQKGWTQGTLARDKRGRPVIIIDEKACAFCLIGAIRRAEFEAGMFFESATTKVLRKLILQNGFSPENYHTVVSEWNDASGRTRYQVLSLLSHALSEAP